MRGNIGDMIAMMLYTAVPLVSTQNVSGGLPDPTRDTITPVYYLKRLPYDWAAIRAGRFPVAPVHWTRSSVNPMVECGMNPRAVSLPDAQIRVFYGQRGEGRGIFYFDVTAADPETIVKGPVGPIISTGPVGAYDDSWVICPEPVRVSTDHLRMYYSAMTSGREFFCGAWSLAVADSYDNGETWHKYEHNPILTTGEAPWESGAVGFCSVEKVGDFWRMWYLGTDDIGGDDACKQVGFATSTDGIHWERYEHNPVICVNPDLACERGAIAVPRVIRDGDQYKVWYCCYEKNNTYAIGHAESFDGIMWSRSPHNPVLSCSGVGWDSSMTEYPCVIRVGTRYLMWYCGNGYGGAGIGLASAPVPTGLWFWRVGPSNEPDDDWSAWQPVGEAAPACEGYIQFAVCAPRG